MAHHHGQFANFAAAVVRQLPTDLDEINAQLWIENQNFLARRLRSALASDKKIASFPTWKKVTLGAYKSIKELSGFQINDLASQILEKMVPSTESAELELVLVSRHEVGLSEPSEADFLDFLRATRSNGLGFCPMDVIPILRLAFLNQDPGTWVHVIVPLVNEHGDPCVFNLGHRNRGDFYLTAEWGPIECINSCQWVFVRRKTT